MNIFITNYYAPATIARSGERQEKKAVANAAIASNLK